LRITAFDFETCSRNRATGAVELGVCLYRDGKLSEQRSWRFFPLADEFDAKVCKVSGFVRSDVEGLPTFGQLWNVIRPYFMVDVIIAHNLWGFDFDVLSQHLTHLGEAVPNSNGLCTYDLSRAFLPALHDHKLPTVCQQLGIPFSKRFHHSAMFDAKACGEAFFKLLKLEGSASHRVHQMQKNTDDFRASSHDIDVYDDYIDDEHFIEDDLEDEEFTLDYPLGKEHLDSDDDRDSLINLSRQFFRFVDSNQYGHLLQGWAFSITGDVVDVRDARSGLADALIRLGAKCDVQNQNFAKSSRAPHGPTNTIVFAKGIELARLLNGDVNSKFHNAAEAIAKDDRPIKLLTERALYEFVFECVHTGRSPSYEDYTEEELVREMVRPILVKKAAELAAEKQARRKR
jgi:DNA polymerase-3 subunit epsilon